MTTRHYAVLIALASAITLTACEKSTKDAQADAVRDTSDAAGADIDRRADAVLDRGEAMGNAAEKQAEAGADAMRETADDVRDRGERQADAVEAGTSGATTRTDRITTTTQPDPQ
ncbi:hypothetical protein [Sandarakinorhabdus rubra]|uniref:hypothetical protein n=1 Tax=Sandarakinorhabdus rubra TaxID=2672568 RepID=UPI0013DC0575|nr:hypothetical protein [Sandarakinorhabdus rubra]